jgi:hypothetical protein
MDVYPRLDPVRKHGPVPLPTALGTVADFLSTAAICELGLRSVDCPISLERTIVRIGKDSQIGSSQWLLLDGVLRKCSD